MPGSRVFLSSGNSGYLWPFSHDGNLRILKFNCKCAFWNTQRTHERSTSVFWITHRTHERSRNVILERAKRRVWVACQSKHARVLFTFPLHVCSTVRRRKWFEGHASSAPQNTILRSSHSHTDFVAWFARIVSVKHLCTVIWDAHFKTHLSTCFGVHTVFFAYFEI